MKAPAWWRRYLDWRQRHVGRLVLEPDGFWVAASSGRHALKWDMIRQVTAFKRDLMAVDLLCLAIATSEHIVEIHEQMVGYPDVEAQLCSRLGIGQEWKLGVLFPAFATNATLLFDAGKA